MPIIIIGDETGIFRAHRATVVAAFCASDPPSRTEMKRPTYWRVARAAKTTAVVMFL
jgi:hypothetical protein